MSLIKCPECGKEISSKATKCPNCGRSMKSNNRLAIAGMILGIISLILSFTNIGIYFAAIAFLMSVISMGQDNKPKVLSIIGISTSIIVAVIWLIVMYIPII